MYVKRIFFFAFAFSIFCACAPEEGKGGLASIEGKVLIQNINALQEVSGTAYAAIDEDVFISYGNSGLQDDKESTGPNGKYKFENLTKGDYTIFVFSDDPKSNAKSQQLMLSQDVSLTKRDEATLNDFIIYKHVDYDDGNGVVKGNIQEGHYQGSTLYYTIPAQDADVYLQYENSDIILDRARTDGSGNYEFGSLIPGKYKLYVYSENQISSKGDSVSYAHFEISANDSEVTIDTINTKKFKL